MSEFENEILMALAELMRKKINISVSDVYKHLKKKGIKKSEKWIRITLEKLVAEGKVKKIESGRISYYIPLVKQATLEKFISVKQISTRQEIGEQLSEDLWKILTHTAGDPVPVATAKRIAADRHFPERLREKIEKIADDLADENPREILQRMFKDLADRFKKYAEKYKKINDKQEKRRLREKLNNIYRIIKVVYEETLGIPISTSKIRQRGKLEVMRIHLPDRKTGEYILEYDLNTLNLYLNRRIPDDKFIIKEETERELLEPMMGIDASTMPVEIIIPHITRRIIRLYVNTVIGVTDVKSEKRTRTLIFPRPESIERLNYLDAEERGFLIRPDTLFSYPAYYHDRIREAQMNYLEHQFVTKILAPFPEEKDIYEVLKRPPCIIFMDGRIFPYEHKIDDYVALHKKYVQRSIAAFVNLMRSAEALRNEAYIVGVVKRGHLAYLWSIVSWYLLEKGLISEDEFLDPQNLITEDEMMRDEYIAYLLLKKHYNHNSNSTPRTFTVIRRFYAMDPKTRRAIGVSNRIDNENRVEFWLKEANVSETAEKPGLAGYVEEKGGDSDEAWFYSEACARGAVAMFYFIPLLPNGIQKINAIRIPRYEVLIPYSCLNQNEEDMRKTVKQTIRKIILDGRIEEDLYLAYEEADEYRILIVPKYVKEAHHYAKSMEKEITHNYGIYLISKALEALKTIEEMFFGGIKIEK